MAYPLAQWALELEERVMEADGYAEQDSINSWAYRALCNGENVAAIKARFDEKVECLQKQNVRTQ